MVDYLQLMLSEAGRVFGDKAKAAAWLSQQRAVFQGRSALDTALDPEGLSKYWLLCVDWSMGFASEMSAGSLSAYKGRASSLARLAHRTNR